MKIALVHDYLNQYGGAERVLEAFCEIWPKAPIYTLIYDEGKTEGAFKNKRIKTSFLQKIPGIHKKHRNFLMLMPFAVEQFDLSGYDVVLSDSASYAKGVITSPKTLHICYCHTPLRYAWDDSHRYIQEFPFSRAAKKVIPFFINYLRIWDREASLRVDKFIANSHFVALRIRKYYQHDSEVIYPPVSLHQISVGRSYHLIEQLNRKNNYFLIVSRLLPYKRIDVAIEAFKRMNLPLVIIGDGPDRERLEKISKQNGKTSSNVQFLGRLSDEAVIDYYKNCLAFVFPQEEDFGISAVEAMSFGKPVIAYRGGGAEETVKEGKTGIFFGQQSVESLVEALKKFNTADFDTEKIKKHASKFGKEEFKKQIKEFVEKEWAEYK